MRRSRYRVLLPTIFGLISLALMCWDYYNVRVIESMGMAWDTGAPWWPYQASWMFLGALNAPVHLVASLVCLPLRLENLQRALFEFPFILLLWHWVGTRVDFGIVSRGHHSWPKTKSAIPAVTSAGLFAFAVFVAVYFAPMVKSRGYELDRGRPLVWGVSLSLVLLWSVGLAAASAFAAIKLLRGTKSPTDPRKSAAN